MSISIEARYNLEALDKLTGGVQTAANKVLLSAARRARDMIKVRFRAEYDTHSKKKGGELVQSVKALRRPKKRGGGAKVQAMFLARFFEFGTRERFTKGEKSRFSRTKQKAITTKAHSTGHISALPIMYPACREAFRGVLSELRDAVVLEWRNGKMSDAQDWSET